MECAISNLEFEFGGGWKIWGEKCYLESRIWGVENAISNLQFGWVENSISNPIFGVENLGWKVLSRISNLGGGGVENLGGECYLESPIWVGGKFGVENAISNLEFGGRKIWGKKC